MAITWTQPKTDWNESDRFNYSDYNRIKNNIKHIYDEAVRLVKFFEIEDMGSDINSYTAYFHAEQFNIFERNLQKIHDEVGIVDWSGAKTFYPNGTFLTFEELNRIENMALDVKKVETSMESGINRIPFRLGNYKIGYYKSI